MSGSFAAINYLVKSQQEEFLGRDDLLEVLQGEPVAFRVKLLAAMGICGWKREMGRENLVTVVDSPVKAGGRSIFELQRVIANKFR